MKLIHIVSGDDGRAHFVRRKLPKAEDQPTVDFANHACANWTLSQALPGHSTDYHVTQKPKLLIVLQGQLEIGVREGESEVFEAGDIAYLRDTAGRGHRSAIVGNEPCRVLGIDWEPSKN